jgi:hypothetical protein
MDAICCPSSELNNGVLRYRLDLLIVVVVLWIARRSEASTI